jgi:hypothetical protein
VVGEGSVEKGNHSYYAAGTQSLSKPAAQGGAFIGNEALLIWLVDPDLTNPTGKPFTVPNELSSITPATVPDPLDPKDRIVLDLSGITWAKGSDPMLNGIMDNGSPPKLMFDKGDGRL